MHNRIQKDWGIFSLMFSLYVIQLHVDVKRCHSLLIFKYDKVTIQWMLWKDHVFILTVIQCCCINLLYETDYPQNCPDPHDVCLTQVLSLGHRLVKAYIWWLGLSESGCDKLSFCFGDTTVVTHMWDNCGGSRRGMILSTWHCNHLTATLSCTTMWSKCHLPSQFEEVSRHGW